ncbi:hypothetical protein, partial [Staphylococcus epidermidis]|uniref:hypothetical protein n=1 Tax=Staphylococcus epidermidis TaxID=1282 RepID=UPI001C9305DC
HMMDEQVRQISYHDAAQFYFRPPYHEVSHPLQLPPLLHPTSQNTHLTPTQQQPNYILQQLKHIINHQNLYHIKTPQY